MPRKPKGSSARFVHGGKQNRASAPDAMEDLSKEKASPVLSSPSRERSGAVQVRSQKGLDSLPWLDSQHHREQSIIRLARAKGETALKAAMASESVVQLGLLMALPMIMEIGLERGFITALEIGLERGFITALSEMIIMQLQLAAVFFTFSLGTKVSSIWFHGLYTSDWLHVVLSFILVIGFLHFIFNPSGFEWQKIVEDWDEWQKIVEDWDDWTKWISSHGGIGMPATKSWESWWAEEQEHLQYTGFMGQFREIVLSISVWSCVLFKIVFMGRKKFSADYQRMFRLLKLFLFIGFIVTLVILFLFLNLTVGDIFVNLLAFMPTGWAPLSVCSLYLSGEFGSSKVRA
ncbi:hypothetical protein V6N12_071233 [Hibiscus sabdariffa]